MSSKSAPKRPKNLLKYHRPRLPVSATSFPPLTEESKACIQNLTRYRSRKSYLKYPRSRRAAVLVALFVGRAGDLYVLLSRRSASLRSFAGDTALPGGMVDIMDQSLEDAARREAFEEIGLPLDRQKVPLLAVLEPFMAADKVIVTPVVVLVLDRTIRPILNEAEVASVFSHPLASFLSSDPPFPAEPELVEVPYHTYNDYEYSGAPFTNGLKRQVRMHRFLTGREAGGIKPVFGVTASILIYTAQIGYNREPDFDVYPPGGPGWEERTAWTMYSKPEFREAFSKEGIDPDWDIVKAIAKVGKTIPPPASNENSREREREKRARALAARRRRRGLRARL